MLDLSARMPKQWARTRIGEVVDINPKWFSAPPSDDDLISFVPMASVEEETGRLDPSTVRIWKEVSKGYTKFQENDVLFAKITPCMENGKYALARDLVDGRGAGSTEFHVFRPSEAVDPKFLLFYLFQAELRRAARLSMRGAAGQLRVPPDFFEALEIDLPPRHEQDRIVAEVEKQFTRLDDAVAALKRVQANLKRYRASVLKAACEGRLVPTEAELARKEGRDYEPASELLKRILAERRAKWEADQFQKMIAAGKPPQNDDWKEKYREPESPDLSALPNAPEGWTWATLDQLSIFVTSGSRGWKEFYSTDGAIFIRSQDIRTDQLETDNVARVSPPKNSEGSRTRVQRGDILVTITGANVAKAAVVKTELDEAYVSQHVGLIRLVSTEIKDFIHAYLIAPFGGRKILLTLAYGAGKPGLNLDNLRSLPIPLPPAGERRRILASLEHQLTASERLDNGVLSRTNSAQRMRQRILSNAFSGKLVPQDPNDEPASVLLERIRAERTRAQEQGGKAPKATNGASPANGQRRKPGSPARAAVARDRVGRRVKELAQGVSPGKG